MTVTLHVLPEVSSHDQVGTCKTVAEAAEHEYCTAVICALQRNADEVSSSGSGAWSVARMLMWIS